MGFTLVELLVVVAVVSLLIGVLLPAMAGARRSAMGLVCGVRARSVGQAVHMYADDSRDELPMSDHAAGFGSPDPVGARLSSWSLALLPYLGAPGFERADLLETGRLAAKRAGWRASVEAFYRCPLDPRGAEPPATEAGRYDGSLGFNVYFVLTPGEIDPTGGSVRTWRRRDATPRPASTVAFGEVSEGDGADTMVDHFMAHFWTQFDAPTGRVAKTRHGSTATYLMLDGHVADLPFERTFDPASGTDDWNPATAGSPRGTR